MTEKSMAMRWIYGEKVTTMLLSITHQRYLISVHAYVLQPVYLLDVPFNDTEWLSTNPFSFCHRSHQTQC